MSYPFEETVSTPTLVNDSSPTTANIEAFTNQLVERINIANNSNGPRPARPHPRLLSTVNTRPYPEHNHPDHNSLHRYLLDPRNTAEVLMRINSSPNCGQLAEIWGWMLQAEEYRLSAIRSGATAAANEEGSRQLGHTHFHSLVELGIFDYVTPQSPRYTPYTADSPEPEPLQPPISILVTTSTIVSRDDDRNPPPYSHIQRVDPATLTRSDDEDTILPVPPPRPRRRGQRSSRTPLLFVGLSGGHINSNQPTETSHRERPCHQQTTAPQPRPNSQQPPAICWECRRLGHTRIHCDRHRCPRCWARAPGHRSERCPHYRSEDYGRWGNHAWNNRGNGGGSWGNSDGDWNDGNHDDAAQHNINT